MATGSLCYCRKGLITVKQKNSCALLLNDQYAAMAEAPPLQACSVS